MKRVFWFMSAVGLTMTTANAQSGVINISSADKSISVVAPTQTLSDEQLNQAIDELIANSQRTSTIDQTFATSTNTQSSMVAALSGDSAPAVAARIASRAAHGKSVGRCALYVRKALQSAGYSFTPQPSAYQYAHGTLASAGFTKISNQNYVPQVGDVAVFNRTSKNPHGHIQIYDGNQWVSDFRQPNFSPYRNHNGYSVWRDARYLDASSNTGTYLAMNEQ